MTCLFSASYVNADISRYYLGPLLIAWTWLAILGAVVVGWRNAHLRMDVLVRALPQSVQRALRLIELALECLSLFASPHALTDHGKLVGELR